MQAESDERGFGLYVHWPFCLSKCPYCDFNSHVREGVDHTLWRDALVRELRHYAALTPGRRLTSIFFGGGTPSLMAPETVEAVIDTAQSAWHFSNAIEITLEANPTSVEAEKFSAFRMAGVNRVSIGVQALRAPDLKFLGRMHSVEEAKCALAIAAKNFERFSFDLIYARPGQSVEAWRTELAEGLALSGGHLSVYQLTIEPGTVFHTRHARGEFTMPDDETAGALYEITQTLLSDSGMPAYEISNHARPGHESRHNLTYWRYGDYVGIGPGAHGRLTLEGEKRATRAHRAPEIWLENVRKNGHGAYPFECITPAQRLMESVMMGLRLCEGVPMARLVQESGQHENELFDSARFESLRDEGYLILENGRLSATPAGRQRLNGLLPHLLADS